VLDCRFSTGATAPDELAKLEGQFRKLTLEEAHRLLKLWTVRSRLAEPALETRISFARTMPHDSRPRLGTLSHGSDPLLLIWQFPKWRILRTEDDVGTPGHIQTSPRSRSAAPVRNQATITSRPTIRYATQLGATDHLEFRTGV